MTQTKQKIVHAHELEELILLKCSNNQGILQVQDHPYQNINSIFHRIRITLKFV